MPCLCKKRKKKESTTVGQSLLRHRLTSGCLTSRPNRYKITFQSQIDHSRIARIFAMPRSATLYQPTTSYTVHATRWMSGYTYFSRISKACDVQTRFLLLRPWPWPDDLDVRNIDMYPLKTYLRTKMNFLDQGFRKSEQLQIDRQMDWWFVCNSSNGHAVHAFSVMLAFVEHK